MSISRSPASSSSPMASAIARSNRSEDRCASSSAAPHVKSGRVRALAVTMGKRSKLNPEWPTLQEAGVKEVDASNWTALFAPKGTPQAIVDKLNAELVKILNMPDVRERFYAISAERRLKHPAVVAISSAAREKLFD